MIRSLIKEGGKAGNITRMIAVLNDHILERMLTLLVDYMGPPPVPFCFLLMGSEGRREQTFRTDQDNAIIYADPVDEEQKKDAESYFKEFARQAIDQLVNRLTRRQEIYLMHLAKDCLAHRPPLSFFKSFIVQKNGEHKNTLDIKGQGITPFVNFARIMALKHEINETNTLARFNVLVEKGHVSRDFWQAATDAYELQMQLRLVHQLYQIDNGILPDNHINPANLTELEKQMLKEAFTVIERLQSLLKTIFPVV
jgi:signal-transduction protein with cAMP-binding, CBS, and nucleotidyltransferase domain